MFNEEKREQKRADKLARMEEAERLCQDFNVNTLGNKKTLDKLIQQVNDTEILKCVIPGNVKITEKATGGKIASFPGAWLVSDQRVLLCFPTSINLFFRHSTKY